MCVVMNLLTRKKDEIEIQEMLKSNRQQFATVGNNS